MKPVVDNGLPIRLGETLLLRAARPDDALAILGDLRQEDIDEWEASVEGGIFWLENTIMQSDEGVALADYASDMPIVIFGCIRRDRLPADIWMVASVFGPARAQVGWYLAIDWIEQFWTRWPDVHCWSDARNVIHHKWLRWLRFEQGPTAPWGKGLPFHYFRRQSDV